MLLSYDEGEMVITMSFGLLHLSALVASHQIHMLLNSGALYNFIFAGFVAKLELSVDPAPVLC